ncbi:MAG: methyltransferase domain-containing protein [Chloroflexota bacterium]|nr:methyltransferase domain-containing protein [Chloroflexota bacterium]
MSSSSPDHKAVVRQEFTQQAQAYAANSLIRNPDRLAALVQAVHPHPGARVLDVATGPGYVAAAFAEAGCEVVGLDLTPAPLALAEQMREARGLTNLHFQLGDAEQLPWASPTFDIVVSRYALHHCEDPQRVLTEMARVCHFQGMVVIQDLIVSEFPARAAYQNRFEQLRDTSHTRALPLSELLALFTICGLEVEKVITNRLTMPLEAWLANAHTSSERASQVRELIEQDEHQDLSGTHPFRDQEVVSFYQHIATLIARKIALG